MTDANKNLLKLALAAKGYTGASADEIVDMVEAAGDSLLMLPDLIESQIALVHAKTLQTYASVGLALLASDGYEDEGVKLMAGVKNMLAEAAKGTTPEGPVGAEGDEE